MEMERKRSFLYEAVAPVVWGHAVALLTVAVCYKPEGHGFVSDEVVEFFFFNILVPNPSSRTMDLKLI
jgi:hypothetical protein